MLVVAGASCGMAVTFSCNDPFSGYETTLACFMMACVVVLGALFLVSWALRATSPLPPSGQRIHCGSGSTARWQWVARATSLVALVYAMWILVMASLHRGTYGNPTYFFLCVFLCLSIIGCITGRQHPRIGGALPILAGVGLCVTLSRSDLLSWSGDRSLLFAALAVPLAVAGFFQLAAGAQRPPADVAGTSCKVRTH
jgi:hypothetical protein